MSDPKKRGFNSQNNKQQKVTEVLSALEKGRAGVETVIYMDLERGRV